MSKIAPTKDEFLVLYPEFVSVPSAQVESAINFADRYLDSEAWGDFFSDAVGLVAAHRLALRQIAGSGPQAGIEAGIGQITSVSAAGVSTSFAQMNIPSGSRTDDFYSKTVYGQEYISLRNTVVPVGILAL